MLCSVSLAALAAAAWRSGSAAAQDVDAPAVEERIVVTGTRLRGVAPVGSPLSTIDSESMEIAAETSTARIIQQLPQVYDLGISEASRGQNGGSGNIVYGTGMNLRGLGPYATLVLVDGHRAINNNRALDPSVIPALGLERIEVLTDGASAIYGSDAVAGVVNLVPLRFRDGAEIFGRLGFGDAYEEHQVGAAYGQTWDGGQIHVAYENARRSAVHGADRDFFRQDQTAEGGLDYRIAQCDPGNIIVGATVASGVSYAIPEGGVTPANNSSLVAGTRNLCEGSLNQDLLPEQQYDSFNVTFNQRLTGAIELVADGFYSERDFYRAVAHSVADLTVPSTNAFFVAPPGLAPASEFVRYNFANDLPSNDSQGFARNYEVTVGARVELPANWRFETLATYGEGRDFSETRNGVNNAALAAALASANPATAFDPFGLHRTNPSVLVGLANQIFLAPTDNEFLGIEARLDGKLFALPAGDVLLATGYERQELDFHIGGARGAPTTPVTFRNFSRTVDSLYVELLVPVIANGGPGLQSLDINIAGRLDDYSDVGDTTNPKVGLDWGLAEGLSVRGTYGTSLRAPSFPELYGNSNNLFRQNYTDPTIGGAQRVGVALSGGNLDLKPEESTTWTVGVDFEPEALPGFRFSATYFDIEYEGQIATYLSNLNILSLESEFAGTGIILRDAAANTRVSELLASGVTYATPPAATPVTLFVDGRTFNLGRSLMSGVDLEAAYTWSMSDVGDMTASLNAGYISEYEDAITPSGTLVDRLDTIFFPHDLKMRGSLLWDHEPFRSYVSVNYVGEYTNNLLAAPQTVDPWVTVDLNVSRDFGGGDFEGFTLGLDVRNLLDEDPPYVNVAPAANGSGGYDATVANPTGRVIGVSLRKRW
jgi:iron complex outermembrane receptor protein